LFTAHYELLQILEDSVKCSTIMGLWIIGLVVVLLVLLQASSAEDAATAPNPFYILEVEDLFSCGMSLKSLVVDATVLQGQVCTVHSVYQNF
jgi:hypothetical protein